MYSIRYYFSVQNIKSMLCTVQCFVNAIIKKKAKYFFKWYAICKILLQGPNIKIVFSIIILHAKYCLKALKKI